MPDAYSRASNPAYTVGDLEYQLKITDAKLLVLHPWNLKVGHAAAKAVGLPLERIVLFDIAESSEPTLAHPTVSQLVDEGLATRKSFKEKRLGPDEGRTRLAYINLSSGTTGKPKVRQRVRSPFDYRSSFIVQQAVCIPHRAVIAGMIQQAHMLNQDTMPWDERKYRPGDRWYAGKQIPLLRWRRASNVTCLCNIALPFFRKHRRLALHAVGHP